uniref:AlNc14C47G3761 protein n=1 Tax=Albugo laibachii Nc14 TaxID=890382 RepID=F0WAP7_9STRA|nr:AlNc14C47G3761 [Albugo laibachii Nc14]|eukprot:CCA18218.1 AlNc14C47G3761 [Albugo laibachii Nc14]
MLQLGMVYEEPRNPLLMEVSNRGEMKGLTGTTSYSPLKPPDATSLLTTEKTIARLIRKECVVKRCRSIPMERDRFETMAPRFMTDMVDSATIRARTTEYQLHRYLT